MTDLIFAAPWWLIGLIAGIGVILFISANKRQETSLRSISLGVIGLAIALAIVSYLVDTDLEKAVKRTRTLVASVDKRDWETLRSLLDPQVSFAIYSNRDQIISGAKIAVEQWGLKSIRITSLKAEKIDTLVSVSITVIGETNQTMGYRPPSNWRLDWQETDQGWQLFTITPLPDPYNLNSQIQRQLPNP